MQENDQDTSVVNEEVVETEGETEVDTTETTDTEESPQALKARLQRAEKKIEKMKLDAKVEKKAEKIVEKQNTGELDETQLDYLDLKGISETEDIKVIEDIVKKTGMTIRQALKDDYVVGKLDKNKANREVKDATPSASKRSGGSQTNDLATAIAKYDANGTLPDDFALRSAVINAKVEASNTNKPAWHH